MKQFIRVTGVIVLTMCLNTYLSLAQEEAIHVDTSGNVGIGTSIPAGKLHVGTTSSDGNVKAWGSGQLVVGQPARNVGGIGLRYSANNNTGYISSLSPNIAWRDLGIRANNTIFFAGGNKEAMRLDSTGALSVKGRIKDQTGYLVPVGGIIMYTGSAGDFGANGIGRDNTAVQGWALCDVQGGRPDLRSSFIVGANPNKSLPLRNGLASYYLKATGGNERHTLSVAEMPNHSHGILTNNGKEGDGNGDGEYAKSGRTNIMQGDRGSTGYTQTGAKYTSPTRFVPSPLIEPAGGNQSFETLPPYYAVFYIVKL